MGAIPVEAIAIGELVVGCARIPRIENRRAQKLGTKRQMVKFLCAL